MPLQGRDFRQAGPKVNFTFLQVKIGAGNGQRVKARMIARMFQDAPSDVDIDSIGLALIIGIGIRWEFHVSNFDVVVVIRGWQVVCPGMVQEGQGESQSEQGRRDSLAHEIQCSFHQWPLPLLLFEYKPSKKPVSLPNPCRALLTTSADKVLGNMQNGLSQQGMLPDGREQGNVDLELGFQLLDLPGNVLAKVAAGRKKEGQHGKLPITLRAGLGNDGLQ